MGFLSNITQGIKDHFDSNKEERKLMQKIDQEVKIQRLQAFKEQYSRDSAEVAKILAKRDAARLSGIQKLRAENRSRRLDEHGPPPGSMFDRLSEFTKKNKERMERNIQRNTEMREIANIERRKEIERRRLERQQKIEKSRLSNGSTWKM